MVKAWSLLDLLALTTIVRDALLGKAPAPVAALAAWRVARLMEWAMESSEKHREISCDWSEEPK